MNLGELIDLVRARLQDVNEPYAWSDIELIDYLNTAVVEATERSRLLLDTTSSITQLSLVANTAEYSIDPSIQSIRRILVDTGQKDSNGNVIYSNVYSVAIEDLEILGFPPWEKQITATLPTYYWLDLDTKSLHFVPVPTTNTTAKLEVFRAPLSTERLVKTSDKPPIPERTHRYLAHWAAYEALLKRDADMGDSGRAAQELAFFEREFGPRPSARLNRHFKERRTGQVYSRRFGG